MDDWTRFLLGFLDAGDRRAYDYAVAQLACPVRRASEYPDLDLMVEVRDRLLGMAERRAEAATG